MKSITQSLVIAILCIPAVQAAEAQKGPAKKAAPNTAFEHRFANDLKQTADSETRLDQWFRDAKFGAFIHFGVYSSLEGEYQGRGSQHRYSEWIQVSGEIPADEYHQVAARFNPAYLANGRKADFVQEGAALKITLPAKPLSKYDTVVKVGFTKSIGEQ